MPIDLDLPIDGERNWGPKMRTAVEDIAAAVDTTLESNDTVMTTVFEDTGSDFHQVITPAFARGLSVTAYGATGDGTTNDTTSLQAAADAVEALGGGTLHIPPGVYLSDSLTIPSGVIVRGDQATLKLRSSSAVFLTIEGSRAELRGVKIDCDSKATNFGIDFAVDATDCVVAGNEITGMSGAAGSVALIRIRRGNNRTVIRDNWIHGVETTTVGRGILVSDTLGTVEGVKIVNNTIENIERAADGDGIVIQDWPGAVEVLISGNTFRRCRKRAVKIQNAGVIVSDNFIDLSYDAGQATQPYSGISTYASQVVVQGNRIAGVFTIAGIEVGSSGQSLTDITIIGNQIIGDTTNRVAGTQDGITVLTSSCKRATVHGNILFGTRFGIRFQNVLEDISIIGNTIVDCLTSAIVIDDNAGTAATNVAIIGNLFRTLVNYAVTTDGGAAPTSMTVQANVGTGAFGFFGSNAAAGSKLGFHGATPVVKPAALVQTYSTADRTLGAYTSDPESAAYTSTPAALANAATLVDLNALRVAYENLRAFTEDLAQHHNAVVDDLQAYGLEQ